MWKLLPVCLLVSCAVNDQQPPDAGQGQSGQGRIVRQVELPLRSSAHSPEGQPARRSFEAKGTQGWLDASGAWQINREVHHGRLRCGSYETGIQLGRGNPACSSVEWLTNVEYATRLRHCNSASRVHAGGGSFSHVADRLEAVSCVRIVVRCEGTC